MAIDDEELERGERIALHLFKIGGTSIGLGLLSWLFAIWTPEPISGNLGLTGILFFIPGVITMFITAISLRWIE